MPAIARSLGQQFGQQFGQLGQLFAVHCEALIESAAIRPALFFRQPSTQESSRPRFGAFLRVLRPIRDSVKTPYDFTFEIAGGAH